MPKKSTSPAVKEGKVVKKGKVVEKVKSVKKPKVVKKAKVVSSSFANLKKPKKQEDEIFRLANLYNNLSDLINDLSERLKTLHSIASILNKYPIIAWTIKNGKNIFDIMGINNLYCIQMMKEYSFECEYVGHNRVYSPKSWPSDHLVKMRTKLNFN